MKAVMSQAVGDLNQYCRPIKIRAPTADPGEGRQRAKHQDDIEPRKSHGNANSSGSAAALRGRVLSLPGGHSHRGQRQQHGSPAGNWWASVPHVRGRVRWEHHPCFPFINAWDASGSLCRRSSGTELGSVGCGGGLPVWLCGLLSCRSKHKPETLRDCLRSWPPWRDRHWGLRCRNERGERNETYLVMELL